MFQAPHVSSFDDEIEIDRRLWGEFQTDGEVSEEEEEEEDEEEESANGTENGFETPAPSEGYATPSGTSTVTGLDTPEGIELRKKRTDESSLGGETPQLYTVLQEKRVDRIGNQIMGSTHVYDISKKHSDAVEVSLNPEDLDNTSKKMLEEKYEEQLRKRADNRSSTREDLSDLVNEHVSQANVSDF